jgi:predicted  nucleic acid-binding Zn-ribbon protein
MNVLVAKDDQAASRPADRDEVVTALRAQPPRDSVESATTTGIDPAGEPAMEGCVEGAREQLYLFAGALAGLRAECGCLLDRNHQMEDYADSLRRQLADLHDESQAMLAEQAALRAKLEQAQVTTVMLQQQVEQADREAADAKAELDTIRMQHADELRRLRFDLQEAETTVAESTQLSEQLAIDLANYRGHNHNLERQLGDHERESCEHIEALEKRIVRLERTVYDYERQLETRSNAIHALMEELSRVQRSHAEFLAEDGIISADDSHTAQRLVAAERVTRLLVGRFHDQDLRFPLFKNMLTIGRTRDNDIYLNADDVSRRHAVVVTDGGKVRIIDWGSKNGVYVNSMRISEHFLHRGDMVSIGSVEFRYEELSRRDTI